MVSKPIYIYMYILVTNRNFKLLFDLIIKVITARFFVFHFFSSCRPPLMLTGWRNLYWTRRLLMCKSSNFNALPPSSSASSTVPCLPSPTQCFGFLKSRQTSVHFPSSWLNSPSYFRFSVSARRTGPMELKEVLQTLEQLAPLSLAEPWDNVGLLVEPSKSRPIKTILLTNDLTDAVMEEAEALSCDLIVSYHPPLFQPIKRLIQKDWKQRLAIRAVEAGMAVFSPHTSWDSMKEGVNDWLVGGLGKTFVI